ncbi:MAG TPA: ribosome maturation factor RimM [Pseudomonadales bacterium]|jgi:16S rRNA processing protein RimM
MSAVPDKVVVGKIGTAWGVRGWVKVLSFTEEPERLLEYPHLLMQRDGRWQALKFEESRVQGAGLVARIADCHDRDQALAYRNCLLAIESAEMPSLDAGEYYWHQLMNQKVVTEVQGQSVLLGRVDHLIETGANDVLVVKPCDGSVDQQERLIPWLPGQYVETVDLDAGEIRVDWDPDF